MLTLKLLHVHTGHVPDLALTMRVHLPGQDLWCPSPWLWASPDSMIQDSMRE